MCFELYFKIKCHRVSCRRDRYHIKIKKKLFQHDWGIPFSDVGVQWSKNSNQLKSTSSNSEEGERSHFLNAGTHPISNKSGWNSCYSRQSKGLCPTRWDEKESGGKICGKKSKHIVREHNQETFNFGFQGNIEENARSHDCNR